MQYWCVCTYESAGGCSPVYSWLSWQADREADEAVGNGRQQCHVRFKLQVSWIYLSVDERSGVPAMCMYVWFSVAHIIHMHMSHEKFQYVCIHTYNTAQTMYTSQIHTGVARCIWTWLPLVLKVQVSCVSEKKHIGFQCRLCFCLCRTHCIRNPLHPVCRLSAYTPCAMACNPVP